MPPVAPLSDHGHSHIFNSGDPLAEKNTRWAVVLTATMMVAEIAGGLMFGSMALLADGWHMSSHALALGLSAFVYVAARKLAHDPRFNFGTWKIEVLGGYTSALLLLVVAAGMVYGSAERLLTPQPIAYDQAIGVGVLGLLVNLACAWLLRDGHHHHDDDHQHVDLNLRAAYVHVVADAATSVLAIVALLGGKFWGANWLDPVMGLAGAVLVARWAVGLLRQTSRVLLDAEMDAPVVAEIRAVIASLTPPAQITDLHVWRVGQAQYACILALKTTGPLSADQVRQALAIHQELAHVSVEVR